MEQAACAALWSVVRAICCATIVSVLRGVTVRPSRRHVLLLFAFTVISATTGARQQAPPAGTIDSPRLAILARSLEAGDPMALAAFWRECDGRTPLVEVIPGDGSFRRVTFVYRGGEELDGIILIGPLPPEVRQKPLSRLPRSDVWFLTARLPISARFSYAFARAGRKLNDPFNARPLTIDSESVAEMDDAPPQPWVKSSPDVPHGEVNRVEVVDTRLKLPRGISVYTPVRSGAGPRAVGLLILFDAWDYLQRVPLPTVLDNLIAAERVDPMVALLVHNESQARRNRDLSCNDDFARFLAEDLVPWAHRTLAIATDPQRTVIGGSSLGGVAGACAALRYPNVFGNVLSQSGAFWYYRGWPGSAREPNDVAYVRQLVASTPKVPVRFYLEAGLFETDRGMSILLENQKLRQALTAKGYEVTYSEFAGGHDFVAWRGSLADGLLALAGRRGR
jgi:enterochelin esterase-like enzyme